MAYSTFVAVEPFWSCATVTSPRQAGDVPVQPHLPRLRDKLSWHVLLALTLVRDLFKDQGHGTSNVDHLGSHQGRGSLLHRSLQLPTVYSDHHPRLMKL